MNTISTDEARTKHTIAGQLIERMKREVRGKVVNLKDVVAGRAAARELQETVVSKERLADLHPAHAAYVYAQNQISVMSEQLTALKEMSPFVDIVSTAEDMYMPGGPPMSPLTLSYFNCWAFFDACVGPLNETIGTTVLEVGAAFGMEAELLRLMRLMQDSRMGLYVHEGRKGRRISLRDIATDQICQTIIPAGYRGQKGDILYVRVLPPPIAGAEEHVAFTTPYVLLKPDLADWKAYLRRAVPEDDRATWLGAVEGHLKYGPTRSYWNDFVLEAYVNHRTDAIYLAGLPDVPESRPHSMINS